MCIGAECLSASELRRQMAAILDRVKAGESFVITHWGRAVARLVPVASGRAARHPGTAAGQVLAGSDFDEPLPQDLLGAFELEASARST